MTTPPPTPRGVIVSLLTPVSPTDTSFRTVSLPKGNSWEYNNGSRLTVKDINNDKIAEFQSGCYSGVAYIDSL